jgi:UDP-2,3-diacylglucosamine hydrolase
VTTLYISDLHLEEGRPEIAEIFFRFLTHGIKEATALYILGDFFEAWIGDDDLSDFNQSVINALQQATKKGLPIYFMHGNRDFLVGRRFLKATGCQLLPDEHVVKIAGVPTLLMHGDTLCTADIAYLKFRKKSRNWFMQQLFLLKSLKKRQAIAADMREKSKAYTSMASEKIMDVSQDAVQHVMQQHHVQHVIHGHTHRPAVHHFELNGQPATRTVLAPWHEHGSVLICEESGKQEMVILD